MTIQDKIKKQEQKVARLEKSKALQKIKERKKDTRKKIELGGLVVKAKMDQYAKDIILGALLDAKSSIESDSDIKNLFSIKGKQAFLDKD